MLANWVKQATATTGTGTITLGAAETGYVAFGDQFADGDVVYYTIEDGNNRESGIGTYTATGTTLSRDTVLETLVSGTFDNTSPTAITLSGSAIVSCSATSQSFLQSKGGNINVRATSQYVVDAFSNGTANNRGCLAGWVFIQTFYMVAPVTLSGLGVDVKTLATTGSDMHIGLYKMDYTDNTFDLIDTTGLIDVSSGTGTTGFNTSSFAGGNINLNTGLYFIGLGGDSDAVVDGLNHNTEAHPFMPCFDDNRSAGIYYTTGYSSGLATTLAAPDHNNTQTNGVYPNAFGVLA